MAPVAIGVAVALAAALGWTRPAHAAPPATGSCRVVEDFKNAPVGEFPPQWKVRKDEGRAVYSVQQDGPLRFLRAVSKALGIQAAREVPWDLAAMPVLTWSWRVEKFPDGADEKSGKNDSAVAVYMFVPYSKVRGPRALKYIWSEKVAAGTRLESNQGLTKVIVLRSGAGKKGQWVEERVNARDDYRKAFAEDKTPKPAGIGVLTDADDTDSTAHGDYATFKVCRG